MKSLNRLKEWLLVIVIILLATLVASCGREAKEPTKPSIAGTYICTKASIADQKFMPLLFEKGDVLELKEPNELRLTDPKGGPTIVGHWGVKGDEIELDIDFFGLRIIRKGTVKPESIGLEDGSVWKQERKATKPAPPTPTPRKTTPALSPTKAPPSAIAPGTVSVEDFMVALSSIKRDDKAITLGFAITKVSDIGFQRATTAVLKTAVILTDDHANKYQGSLNIDPAPMGRLPSGFTFTTSVTIAIPKAATIMKIQLGSAKEVDFKDVQFVKPRLIRDYGAASIQPGARVNLGKYVTLTFGGPSSGSAGWTLPITVANADYNPVGVDVGVVVQFADGWINWYEPESITQTIAGLSEVVLAPRVSILEQAMRGNYPLILLLGSDARSTTRVEIFESIRGFMPVTLEQFPALPERIAFSLGDKTYVMKVDGSDKTALVATGHNELSFSPDGSKLAHEGVGMFLADGTAHRSLARGSSPAWSPDGGKIVFASQGRLYEDKGSISVMKTDGTEVTKIVEETSDGWTTVVNFGPVWSPDGKNIAFTRRPQRSYTYYPNDQKIVIVNADGTSPAVLITDGYNPAWSPDGARIAFLRDTDLYVIAVDSSGLKKLARATKNSRIAWSPDAKRIAFTKDGHIWVMNADGSDQTRLTEGRNPTWAPAFGLSLQPTAPGPSHTEQWTIKIKRQAHGHGQIETLVLESEYLPIVVASENAAAPYESLKAQAIASRSFALYKKLVEPRSKDYDILDSEADQVYNPEMFKALTQSKQEEIRQAVKETEEVVLKYAGKIVCAFFVSGTGGTEKFVTYNEGKAGDGITQTSLGLVTDPPSKNPYNRGAMGQVQANGLASKGYSWQQILRYFYGSDIEISRID